MARILAIVAVGCLVVSLSAQADDPHTDATTELATDAASGPVAVTAEIERFFENEVRPLLVAQCGDCHGPGKAESGLRLDRQSSVRSGGDSGPIINENDPDESLLIAVLSHEGDIRMPPDGKLSDRQIDILRRWVADGAPWPAEDANTDANPMGLREGPISDAERQHWAYQAAVKPPVPTGPRLPIGDAAADRDAALASQLVDWPDSDIDRFLVAAMHRHGLGPAADADKLTWLRRATFDLTGLPPTPDELRDFAADNSPGAHAAAIDRLLDSPHYGERQGRHWLDVVRYADTAGDGADYPIREAYQYRDYVIRSFNTDKPYNQFLREQIAGDILAGRAAESGEITAEEYADLVTATGYIAMTKRFGYNINTEFQHLDIADTLDNLGQTVLGLSIGCARCHDHKYDAITAEDYYALYGIFASSQYSFPGGEEYKKPHNLVPAALPSEVAAARRRIDADLAGIDARIADGNRQRDEWLAMTRVGLSRDPGLELQTLSQPGGSPWFTAGPNQILAEAQSPYAHAYSPADVAHAAGSRGVRISHGLPTDGIRQEFASVTAEQTPRFHFNLDFRNVDSVDGDGAYRFYLGHGAIQSLALEFSIDSRGFWSRNGDQFQRIRDLTTGDWYNLQLTVDMAAKTFTGRIGRPGDVVEFGPMAAAPGWDGLFNTFVSDGFGRDQSPSPTRDVDNVICGLEPFPPMPSGTQEGVTIESPQAANESADASLASISQKIADWTAEAQRLTAEREAVAASVTFPLVYGVTEGTPADARLQRRGEPDRPGDAVPRRFLDVLGGDPLPPDEAGSGRLQLAEWLTRPTNPLTARVMVNRVWQQLFGRGLVRTPNDFGVRGEAPSHPELLDFLAADFMADGWSIKRLQRRIMLSRVYRLSSNATPEMLAIDPENRWFARHRRRPLDAESIRDSVLAVSGRLDHTPSGPHPFPDVNSWGFTIHHPFHAVYDSNRRSVYLMIQRARRHPFLALFDAADPNISTATRQATITPTQSLYLMNSPLIHDQAAVMAETLLATFGADGVAGGEDAHSAIRHAYLLTVGREPSEEELTASIEFLDLARQTLESGANETTDRTDAGRAAWAALCRVMMTSNGFLYVD